MERKHGSAHDQAPDLQRRDGSSWPIPPRPPSADHQRKFMEACPSYVSLKQMAPRSLVQQPAPVLLKGLLFDRVGQRIHHHSCTRKDTFTDTTSLDRNVDATAQARTLICVSEPPSSSNLFSTSSIAWSGPNGPVETRRRRSNSYVGMSVGSISISPECASIFGPARPLMPRLRDASANPKSERRLWIASNRRWRRLSSDAALTPRMPRERVTGHGRCQTQYRSAGRLRTP